MALKFLKHKWQKAVFIFVLIATAMILILAVFVNRYWSPILANKVRDVVISSSDSLYKVDFSDAKLQVLQGKITIYDISLKPDTAVYNKKKRLHLAPNNLVEVHVKRLVLLHVHPFSLYFDHKLDIGQIILNQPELNVSYQLNHIKDTVVKDHRTVWQKISKSLKSIHIGNIVLGDVNFKYTDYSGNKVAISELKELTLSANDLLIDSATQTDRSRLAYCKDIVAELNNYSGQTASGLYTYKIKHLKLSTLNSQLNIEGFAAEPATTDVFFDKSRKDRLGFNFDSIQVNNFDYLGYHKYRRVSAASMILDGGSVTAFTNPNKIQVAGADKINSFPTMMIHKLNTDLKIDTVRLHNIDVMYSEFNKKSKKTGTLIFSNTSGYIYNVTTNKEAIAKNNVTPIKLTTYFMRRGRLDVEFKFILNDDNASFTYKGTLGPMNFNALNPAIIPLAMVKVTSGSVKKLSFDIQANKKVFKGNVDFLYNNLKIVLLKADTANDRLKRKSIVSMYANLFVIKHDNPDDNGGKLRSAYVIYTRPKDSPFFKTIWKTLLTGIKPCIGLDEKTQKATTEKIAEQQRNKEERQVKKAERKKRKEERKLKKEKKKK